MAGNPHREGVLQVQAPKRNLWREAAGIASEGFSFLYLNETSAQCQQPETFTVGREDAVQTSNVTEPSNSAGRSDSTSATVKERLNKKNNSGKEEYWSQTRLPMDYFIRNCSNQGRSGANQWLASRLPFNQSAEVVKHSILHYSGYVNLNIHKYS